MEESFRKRFETYTDEQLVQVLLNADNYQKTAVQVAKKEASQRNLSLPEEEDFDRQKAQHSKGFPQLEALQIRLKKSSLANVETSYKEGSAADRSIIITCTIFCFLALSELWFGVLYLINIPPFQIQEFIYELIPSTFVVSVIITSTILLWKHKGVGWYMASTYSVFLLLMNGYFFVKSCIYHLQNDFTINNSDLDGSSLSDLLSLFEPEPAISFVPVLVIALLLLYQLFRKETVAIFGFTSMNIMAVGLLGISLFGASLLVTGYW